MISKGACMLGKLKTWFTALSTAGKVGVVAGASIIGLAAASPNTSTNTPTPQLKASTDTQAATTCESTITYSSETQTVAYASSTVDDNSINQGQSKITTVGVNGEKELKHKITKYSPSGCKADSDEVVSTAVTKQPVNQVTAVGTYVAPAPAPTDCPNGTYVNSAGNTVCSPYNSPSAPAGATAQCVDGTYSFSQSRSGTCSHHGGVAQWL